MSRIWDVESNKFVEVYNGYLNIKREATDGINPGTYISSNMLKLAKGNKVQEIMDKMANLWNNSNDNQQVYDMEQVVFEENKCTIKMSVFFDEDRKEHLMKFRVISRDLKGQKKIDYIKLNRCKCRELYANIRDNVI